MHIKWKLIRRLCHQLHWSGHVDFILHLSHHLWRLNLHQLLHGHLSHVGMHLLSKLSGWSWYTSHLIHHSHMVIILEICLVLVLREDWIALYLFLVFILIESWNRWDLVWRHLLKHLTLLIENWIHISLLELRIYHLSLRVQLLIHLRVQYNLFLLINLCLTNFLHLVLGRNNFFFLFLFLNNLLNFLWFLKRRVNLILTLNVILNVLLLRNSLLLIWFI